MNYVKSLTTLVLILFDKTKQFLTGGNSGVMVRNFLLRTKNQITNLIAKPFSKIMASLNVKVLYTFKLSSYIQSFSFLTKVQHLVRGVLGGIANLWSKFVPKGFLLPVRA